MVIIETLFYVKYIEFIERVRLYMIFKIQSNLRIIQVHFLNLIAEDHGSRTYMLDVT